MRGINAGLTVALAALLVSSEALAGGFTLPGQGAKAMSRGAAIIALADDLTAIATNPGGLSKLRGTHLVINWNGINAPSSFTRTPSGMDKADPPVSSADPLATVENSKPFFPLGAMLAVSSDFGLDDWTFALAVYGPNAVGIMDFPVDGGQRYLLTKQEMLLLFYTLGVAYGQRNWGAGLTLQWAHVPVSKFSQVMDNRESGPPVDPYYTETDLEATLDLTDSGTFTAQVGGWVRPIDAIEIGLSARVVPVTLKPTGKVTLEKIPGQKFIADGSEVSVIGGDAVVDGISLPMVARAGVRYRHLTDAGVELFDVEVDYVYEAWSILERYDIALDGQVQVGGVAGLEEPIELRGLVLEKRWKDTQSVRVGGSFQAVEDTFWVSIGGFWESGAATLNYSNLDFPGFDRLGVGGGIRLKGYGLDFNLGVLHVFSETREVDEVKAKAFQVTPLTSCPEFCDTISGVPANAGKFEQGYTQFSASLGVHFSEWF